MELARLRLRRMELTDVDALFAVYSNAEVARYLSYPPWKEKKQAEAWIARVFAGQERGSSLQLAVERKEDRAMIGTCTLFNCHEESRRAEIGYALHRSYWGAGYMHETLVALIDFAFKTLGLNRLEADIDPRNAGSRRSLERLGFKSEGRLRERWIVDGEVSDTEYLGLLSAEWNTEGRDLR
ncbi:MAG: GNAT family N-acetyltransferase [Burkholderiales bacterium]|nr:GNAT family N-acetyltransferase [Burkholderiales bacterium]